jgi:hypothetical protein
MFKMTTTYTTARGTLIGLGLLAVLVAVAPAQAGPQIMSSYGDQMPWYGAEINAMGGTGTALYRGGISNILNPAMLAVEQGYRVDAGFSLDQATEDRFMPLFDSFESYVTDAAIASNRQQYWQSGFGIAARILEEQMPLTVGLSLTDRYPFSYTFEEEVRNPSLAADPDRDHILESRLYEVTGTLRNLSLGLGANLTEDVSVGVAVHYAFGTRQEQMTSRDRLIPEDEFDESYSDEADFDLSGVNYTLGVRAKLSERVELGLAWETQLAADGDFVFRSTTATPDTTIMTDYEGFYRYPNAYRAALAFRPRTDPRTTFSVELEYKPWSEMADSQNPGYDNPQDLADVSDVRVGLEHLFYNGMPLRFGFRYIDTYADRDASTSVFSAGVGMPLASGLVSLSLELSKLSFEKEHIFGYPEDITGGPYNSADLARVEDTRFRVGVGYNLSF